MLDGAASPGAVVPSPIADGGTYYDDTPVSMSVFSWGDVRTIPEIPTNRLRRRYFMNKFYGYLAVKA